MVSVPEDWQSPLLLSVDSELRCPICRDLMLAQPMMLACSHTFCSLCIRQALSLTPKCPICRVDAHEGTLRRNAFAERACTVWGLARPALLALQEGAKNATASSSRRRASDDSPRAVGGVDGPPLRRSTRASSTQQPSVKGKGRSARREDDSSDVEIVERETPRFVDPSDPDIRVVCPLCQQGMSNAQLNRHLDAGCHAKTDSANSKAVWGNLMGTQSSKVAKDKLKDKASSRIALLNYAGMTLRQIKDHCQEAGISTTAPESSSLALLDHLKRRHRQFAILFNANLDFADLSDPRRRTHRQLEKELRDWEKLQDEMAAHAGQNTVKNPKAYEALHEGQFRELEAQARATYRSRAAPIEPSTDATEAVADSESRDEPSEVADEHSSDPLANSVEGTAVDDPAASPRPPTAPTSPLRPAGLAKPPVVPPSLDDRPSQPQYIFEPPPSPSRSPSPTFPATAFLAAYSTRAQVVPAQGAQAGPKRPRESSPFDPEGPKPSQRVKAEEYHPTEEDDDSSFETSRVMET